jgi:hypothetical protein
MIDPSSATGGKPSLSSNITDVFEEESGTFRCERPASHHT